jgi:hypothetical protein
MSILEHMAGWAKRESKEHCDYISNRISAEKAGIDPDSIAREHDPNGGKYMGIGMFTAMEIGFERKETAEFLRKTKLAPKTWAKAEAIQPASTTGEGPGLTGKPPSRGHVEERRDKLAELLAEIERRATEKGIEFDRSEFPGIKNEFREFAQKYDQKFYNLPTDNDRLDDDIKPLRIKFLKGNHKGKGTQFFKKLFPELY